MPSGPSADHAEMGRARGHVRSAHPGEGGGGGVVGGQPGDEPLLGEHRRGGGGPRTSRRSGPRSGCDEALLRRAASPRLARADLPAVDEGRRGAGARRGARRCRGSSSPQRPAGTHAARLTWSGGDVRPSRGRPSVAPRVAGTRCRGEVLGTAPIEQAERLGRAGRQAAIPSPRTFVGAGRPRRRGLVEPKSFEERPDSR